jgi:hypothetical protein
VFCCSVDLVLNTVVQAHIEDLVSAVPKLLSPFTTFVLLCTLDLLWLTQSANAVAQARIEDLVPTVSELLSP